MIAKVIKSIENLNSFQESRSQHIDNQLFQLQSQLSSMRSSQLHDFIRQIGEVLESRQRTVESQLFAMRMAKEIVIQASYNGFLFTTVYILPWIVSACRYRQEKGISDRAILFMKERSAFHRSNQEKGRLIQQYEQLLSFAMDCIIFFSDHIPFQPYGKYKIQTELAQYCQYPKNQRNISIKHLSYFSQSDISRYNENYRLYSAKFTIYLKETMDFLSDTVQDTIFNGKDGKKLILSLMAIADRYNMNQLSYCINTVVQQLASCFCQQKYIINICDLLNDIICLGQIQAIGQINIRCVPLLLEYIFPISFKQCQIGVQSKCKQNVKLESKLIDYLYVWFEATRILNLSTKIYEYSFKIIQNLRKPIKIVNKQQLMKQMYINDRLRNNAYKMQQSNEIKRPFICHEDKQTQIVKLLIDLNFYKSSHIKKQYYNASNNNVLDQLSLTSKRSKLASKREMLSSFSQSLLTSIEMKQEENVQIMSHDLIGGDYHGPHKKIGGMCDKSQSNDSLGYSGKNAKEDEHIYYTGKLNKQKQEAVKKDVHPFPATNYFHHFHQSERHITYEQIPLVASPNHTTPSNKSLSLHSSQFSQKQNNSLIHQNHKNIESIYLSKGSGHEGSGEFIHFQNNSSVEQKKNKPLKIQNEDISNFKIEFDDSLDIKINKSQSKIQYGINRDVRIPQTIKKPRFGFKSYDTQESSVIVQHLYEKHQLNAHLREILDIRQIKQIDVYELKSNSNVSPRKYDTLRQSKPKDHGLVLFTDSQTSQIKQNSGDPHLLSQSGSLSAERIPSMFGAVFKKKVQKASVISLTRSFHHQKSVKKDRQVHIADFKKMRELQNQLGKLKTEADEYYKVLEQKDKEVVQLQKEKKLLMENNPYALKKQNDIIKILIQNKSKNKQLNNNTNPGQMLSRELKQSTLRNSSSLKEYPIHMLKLRLSNITGYSKEHKRNIISSRCILLKNDILEIGYNFRSKCVTLYFTLKNYCEKVEISLIENSVLYEDQIKRVFDKLVIGKQIKFKTEVMGIKEGKKFVESLIAVKVQYDCKLQTKEEEFKCQLPLTPYNIARPITQEQAQSYQNLIKNKITSYKTPLYNSCEELILKQHAFLRNAFPAGTTNDEGIFIVCYQWRDHVEIIKIKIKERAFILEGAGQPLETGRDLLESLTNLLVEPQQCR